MRNKLSPALFLWILAVAVSLYLPPLHDYREYITFWDSIVQTFHPYLTPDGHFNGNAYGPLFSVLAPLFWLHALLPRVVFITAWFAIGVLLTREVGLQPRPRFPRALIWASVFLNPFFVVLYLIYGNNEIIMSLLLLLAILALETDREVVSGTLLALAVLYKFTPLVLVPFLFISASRLRWRFALSVTAMLCAGYAISWLLWRAEILEPVLYGLQRPAKFLSLFYFLHDERLEQLSVPLLAFALTASLVVHIRYRIELLSITCITLLTVCLLYKVNHPQFHTSIIVVMLLWSIRNYRQLSSHFRLKAPTAIYIVWLSLIPLCYISMSQFTGRWAWVREVIALPTTAIMAAVLAAFWCYARTEAATPATSSLTTTPRSRRVGAR